VMSVRDATVNSVNAIFAQLDLDVGPDNVRQTAYDLGITTHLDGYPAEGIGGLRIGVTPLEQADAYATLADGGIRNTPTAISKVVFPNGDADVPSAGDRTRAISDGIAYEVTDVLKCVITSGTGTAANFGCPAAGKTGTTDNFTDAWFVGYTPQLSTAVWVGYANSRTSMGYDAFGGTLAAPIWHDYMETAHGSYCDDFPQPQNPVQFSTSWSGAHEVSQASPSPNGTGSSAYTPPSNSTTPKYPPQYYAPGAGQGAAPSPSGSDGGGDTSGSGTSSGGPPAHSNGGGNGSAGGTGAG
jgi:penicillin-binding protein 1A